MRGKIGLRRLRVTFNRLFAAALLIACGTGLARAADGKDQSNDLRVFFVDVEGGQATLFVTPDKHSLLIDTGWPGNNYRDADRIAKAARHAGLTRIDFVLITHYHDDHVGGVPQLTARIPVGAFIDHGPNRELDHGITEHGYAEYQKTIAATGAQHIVAHPGELLPIPGIEVRAISADGKLIDAPLAGAGQPNPFCAASEVRPEDQTENARSLGVEIRFGELRILDLGDLTWDKEMQLMCPVNKLGTADVLVVSHHGFNQSSSPALVDAVHARVAIMDNGAKKGGSTPTLETLKKDPGLESLWQLHFSDEGGVANNTPEKFIANPQGPDSGYPLELIGASNGSFEVINDRTGWSQKYPAPR
jgi:beta-lactamase superfamily II metal-dependent hydrolase